MVNALTGLHRPTGARYAVLRYADFAAADRTVHLGPDHTAAGNPNRFPAARSGSAQTRGGGARCRARSRALVGALTLSALRRRPLDLR